MHLHQQRIIYCVGLSILAILFIIGLNHALWPLVIAAVLAYLCVPLVDGCERIGIHRVVATLGCLLVLVIGFVVFIGFLVPLVVFELQEFMIVLPNQFDRFIQAMQVLLDDLGWTIPLNDLTGTVELHRLLPNLSSQVFHPLQVLITTLYSNLVATMIRLIGWVLMPVFFFFVLSHYRALVRGFYRIFPQEWHSELQSFVRQINAILGGYLRGQGSVAVILALIYGVGLWWVGLPFGGVIGMSAGLLSFIPYVGVGTGIVLSLIMLVTHFSGWVLVIQVALVFLVGQGLESWFLTPKLVGKRVGLSPLAVLLAIIVMGNWFGLIGMMVAIPVTAILKIMWLSGYQRGYCPPRSMDTCD